MTLDQSRYFRLYKVLQICINLFQNIICFCHRQACIIKVNWWELIYWFWNVNNSLRRGTPRVTLAQMKQAKWKVLSVVDDGSPILCAAIGPTISLTSTKLLLYSILIFSVHGQMLISSRSNFVSTSGDKYWRILKMASNPSFPILMFFNCFTYKSDSNLKQLWNFGKLFFYKLDKPKNYWKFDCANLDYLEYITTQEVHIFDKLAKAVIKRIHILFFSSFHGGT